MYLHDAGEMNIFFKILAPNFLFSFDEYTSILSYEFVKKKYSINTEQTLTEHTLTHLRGKQVLVNLDD